MPPKIIASTHSAFADTASKNTAPPANTWTPSAAANAQAYIQHAEGMLGEIRFRLVTRALEQHLPARPCRVVDIGGGFGRQAQLLAQAGHDVVVVDPDETLLQAARDRFARIDPAVAASITLVAGSGERAADLVGTDFDLVCCHSVLLYLADPEPMLRELVRLARPGGLISVLSLNRDAVAMRDALQGDWRAALATLAAGAERGGRYLATRADDPRELSRSLARLGAQPRFWHGVRAFTDHRADLSPDDLADICELEWQAGRRDPYRAVARLFHLIAARV